MGRIPTPEWLRLVDAARQPATFGEKLAAVGNAHAKPMATLIALHYESVTAITRLAQLVDRGGNSVLVDKGLDAVRHWNDAVREANALIGKPQG